MEGLPRDLFHYLVLRRNYLDEIDLMNCELVCRAWKHLFETVWEPLVQQHLILQTKMCGIVSKRVGSWKMFYLQNIFSKRWGLVRPYLQDLKNPDQRAFVKVIIIGAPAVGKTSLLHRVVTQRFDNHHNSTIGAAFFTHDARVQSPPATVSMQIWDTAGQERYKSLGPIYFRAAAICCFVFDLSRPDTLLALKKTWIPLVVQLSADLPYPVLIGNKSDLKQLVTEAEIELVRREIEERCGIRCCYYQTSAKTGENARPAFLQTMQRFHRHATAIPGWERKDLTQRQWEVAHHEGYVYEKPRSFGEAIASFLGWLF